MRLETWSKTVEIKSVSWSGVLNEKVREDVCFNRSGELRKKRNGEYMYERLRVIL